MLCVFGPPSLVHCQGESVINGPSDSEHFTFYHGDSFACNYTPPETSFDSPHAQLKARMMRLRESRSENRRDRCVEALLAPNLGIAYEHTTMMGASNAAAEAARQRRPSGVDRMDKVFGPLVQDAVAALPPSPKHSATQPPKAPLECFFAQRDSMAILFRGRLSNTQEIRQLYREALSGAHWLGAADMPPSPKAMNDAELLLALAFDHMQTLRAESQGPKAEEELSGMSRASMYRTQKLLGSLRGPFAFVIVDVGEKEVFAARDAVGMSELHWDVFWDGSVMLASEKRLLEPEAMPSEDFPPGSYFLGKWHEAGWQIQEMHSFILDTGSVPRINSRGQICKVASGSDLPSMAGGPMTV